MEHFTFERVPFQAETWTTAATASEGAGNGDKNCRECKRYVAHGMVCLNNEYTYKLYKDGFKHTWHNGIIYTKLSIQLLYTYNYIICGWIEGTYHPRSATFLPALRRSATLRPSTTSQRCTAWCLWQKESDHWKEHQIYKIFGYIWIHMQYIIMYILYTVYV